MRTFSEEEQHFVKRILSCGNSFHAGKSLVNNIFCTEGIALLFLDDGSSCILAATSNSAQVKSAKQKLFTILALLQELEQANMIVCLDTSCKRSLYMSSKDTSLAIDRKQYTFDGGTITEDGEIFTMKTTSGSLWMSGRILAQPLANSLHHYMTSEIYATSLLQDLADNSFKSMEVLQYEKELSYARKSLIVSWAAFFVACLSIVIEVPISNEWGISTMDSVQFENLHKSIENIGVQIHETNNKLDSTVVLRHGECTDSACMETKQSTKRIKNIK